MIIVIRIIRFLGEILTFIVIVLLVFELTTIEVKQLNFKQR